MPARRPLRDLGFVFEASPIAVENPGHSLQPLTFLGRYAHEALTVDPTGNII